MLSVVIKAYNEEAKIARALESALAAARELAPLPVEVVLADSCSQDRTVRIARDYPVRIVQLLHAEDRGCGAGVQLGYAAARGEWVYLMDGDMALAPGFLPAALACLQADPGLAGVGGGVIDERVANGFDLIRVRNRSGSVAGEQPWLEGGGLYRRAAIDSAGGYAADVNLKGYEEAELGMRLGAAGWRLRRLAREAVRHVGHDADTFTLLRRHWASGRAFSAGVMLRQALGKPWLARTVYLHRHPLALGLWWLALPLLAWFGALGFALWLAAGLVVALLLVLVKHSLHHAGVSLLSWHYALAAIVRGWFEPRRDPQLALPARELGPTAPVTPQS
ncbi:glycosyltransferase family 2 protein [Paucibacter soli]|uniref:glycosyltransferase family 2 protein n=1 Tax=Paucibacter soli TaxID=3133433 RepID=UPI00309ADDE2